MEVELEASDARAGKTYGARLRFGHEVSPLVEFDYREVADNRGSLAWCSALADRTRELAWVLRSAQRAQGTADGGARGAPPGLDRLGGPQRVPGPRPRQRHPARHPLEPPDRRLQVPGRPRARPDGPRHRARCPRR